MINKHIVKCEVKLQLDCLYGNSSGHVLIYTFGAYRDVITKPLIKINFVSRKLKQLISRSHNATQLEDAPSFLHLQTVNLVFCCIIKIIDSLWSARYFNSNFKLDDIFSFLIENKVIQILSSAKHFLLCSKLNLKSLH